VKETQEMQDKKRVARCKVQGASKETKYKGRCKIKKTGCEFQDKKTVFGFWFIVFS